MQASSHLAGQVLRQLAREHEHDEAKHPQDAAQDDETWGKEQQGTSKNIKEHQRTSKNIKEHQGT